MFEYRGKPHIIIHSEWQMKVNYSWLLLIDPAWLVDCQETHIDQSLTGCPKLETYNIYFTERCSIHKLAFLVILI